MRGRRLKTGKWKENGKGERKDGGKLRGEEKGGCGTRKTTQKLDDIVAIVAIKL